jgi:precorrin-6x reductase
MKRLLVFGGTTEGRELASALSGLGFAVTVSVATEYGERLLEGIGNIECRVGRLTEPEMAALMSAGGCCAVIDATHPYAVEAGENIRRAAERAGVRYFRLARPSQHDFHGAETVFAASPEEAAKLLERRPGNILLTTGSKDLKAYTGLPDFRERVWSRVLPSLDSLAKCLELGFPPSHVICMQGPFSKELNAALLRQLHIGVMVTKDTGAEGGFAEKAEAAAEAGAALLVVRRRAAVEGLKMGELLDALRREAPP